MRRAWRVALVVGLASLLSSGCGASGAGESSGSMRASGGVTVPLRLYRSQAYVKAFVKLTLEGHPYYFVVDSGAAATIVDARIAGRLGLRDDGSPREFAAFGCRVASQPVAIPNWRLGQLHMPAGTMFMQTLRIAHALPGIRIAGLLGSDVLSRFGTVTIDYTHRQLILGGTRPTGGQAVPITVLRRPGAQQPRAGRASFVLATTSVTFDNSRARFLVGTGAASSLIDSTTAARLRLPMVGRRFTATGAACLNTVTVTPVQVRDWSIGGLRFRRAVIDRVHDLLPHEDIRQGIVGIVGSGTLARHGILTIGYADSHMILGGAPS
jgi:gag-polyprotein putative aspartyl protease/Aspartyl protease